MSRTDPTARKASAEDARHAAGSRSIDSRVCTAESLYQSGRTAALVAELGDVESLQTDTESMVRLLMLKGMALFDVGEVTRSIGVLAQAVLLAGRVSAELEFSAAFALFVRRSDFQPPAQVLQDLAQLRQLAARVGAGHSLSSLCLAVARLEGHRGSCSNAHEQLENGRKFASSSAGPSLTLSFDLVEAGLESIAGNIDRARRLAESCYETASACGFLKYRVGSATTLALLSLYAGRAKLARRLVQEVLTTSEGFTYVQLGALDTLAQVELRDGNLGACLELLERCREVTRREDLPARSWYDLAHQQTRCTYHELLEDWDAVLAIVDEVDGELARRQFRAVRTSLLGAKARALAHLGRHGEANRALAVAVRTCPRGAVDPLIGLEASRAVCATLGGDRDSGNRFFDSALTAARSIGHRYHEWWIEHARTAVTPAPAVALAARRDRDTTDTAMLLSDVATILGAGHSIDLLAHRVTAILETTAMRSRLEVQSESGLPYDPTPSTSCEASPADDAPHTFRIRIRGSDRQVAIAVRDVSSIDEISLLKALADLVRAAVSRTTDTDDEEQNLWPRTLVQVGEDAVFRSPRTVELVGIAARLADSNAPVLITGETGTGKEVLARLVHQHSKVRRGPFFPINCASLKRDLVESELFGHRRGAFTGAVENALGAVRAAEGGTFFLDEIGELDLAVQAKLLRFLETGEITPVGEPRSIKVNVRFVAATNADLDALAAAGAFRQDLLYRINPMKIALPPLRERKDEIPALASLFVSRFTREYNRSGLRLGDDLIAALLLYDWPGNIRQLKSEIGRIVLLAVDGQTLSSADLQPEITRAWYAARPAHADTGDRNVVEIRLDQPFEQGREQLERAFIEAALKTSGGRVAEAAQLLGLSRKGLFLKRRRYGLAG